MARCEYTLDPDRPETWNGSPGEQCYLSPEALHEGVWNCPYDAVEGTDRCLFHAPLEEKSDQAVEEAFLDTLEAPPPTETGGNPAKHRFIGAEFGSVTLCDVSIAPDSVGIDLSYAHCSGEFDLSGSAIRTKTFYCIATTFDGVTRFENTMFDGYVAFLGATFGGPSSFDGVSIHDEVDFRRTTFTESVGFEDAQIDERADFSSVTFCGDVSLSSGKIGGNLVFRRAVCRQDLDLSSTTIGGACDLMAMKLQGDGTFDSVRIDGETTLQFASLDGVDKSGLL